MSCKGWTRNIVLLLAPLATGFLYAGDGISGTVRNQTTGRPAAGDTVLLVRLENGMQEEARTVTGANGKFILPLREDGKERLVRVIHEGVNYDQKLTGNSAREIAICDAVAKVEGLTGSVGIVQIEDESGMLKITEMYSVRNNSNPPRTQLSPNNFQIQLPGDATLEAFQAKRGGAVWVNLQAMPGGKQGSYRSDFPIRPGDTLFKFVYRVPESDGASLRVKLPYPTSRFAVLHSPALSFEAAAGAYTNPGRVQGMKLEQATSKTLMTQAPPFAIYPAGKPAATRDVGVAKNTETAVPNPGSRGGAAILLLVLTSIVLLCAALIHVVRRQKKVGVAGRSLEKLKLELLRLESSRLAGEISVDQYATTKRQIEHSIQSSLSKQIVGK